MCEGVRSHGPHNISLACPVWGPKRGAKTGGANKGLEIGLCKGANVSALPKLVLYNLIVNIKVLKNRWVIRGDICFRYAKDANIEAVNEAMVQGWVSLEEIEHCDPTEPHNWVIRGEHVRPSV